MGGVCLPHLERSTLCFMLPDDACWMMLTNLQQKAQRAQQEINSQPAHTVKGPPGTTHVCAHSVTGKGQPASTQQRDCAYILRRQGTSCTGKGQLASTPCDTVSSHKTVAGAITCTCAHRLQPKRARTHTVAL